MHTVGKEGGVGIVRDDSARFPDQNIAAADIFAEECARGINS